jgi:3-oxoacyl-[acyl-carrier protein] reductase
MFSLEGKVALVTGGSRGLGRADALTLAKAGADVIITDILIESDLSAEATAAQYGPLSQAMQATGQVYAEQTAAAIREMGRKAAAYKMDVTDRDQVQSVIQKVQQEFGHIDILINNAGTLDHVVQLEHQSDEFWERDLKVNLTGAYNCAKAVWPIMKAQGFGRIINMASVAGTLGGFGQASYATTKAGILGFTKTLALEGARHGITANAIIPGIIATEAYNASSPRMKERMEARTVFRRPGKPEDIAHAICFLCADEAIYITGVGLNVSGGIELFTF